MQDIEKVNNEITTMLNNSIKNINLLFSKSFVIYLDTELEHHTSCSFYTELNQILLEYKNSIGEKLNENQGNKWILKEYLTSLKNILIEFNKNIGIINSKYEEILGQMTKKLKEEKKEGGNPSNSLIQYAQQLKTIKTNFPSKHNLDLLNQFFSNESKGYFGFLFLMVFTIACYDLKFPPLKYPKMILDIRQFLTNQNETQFELEDISEGDNLIQQILSEIVFPLLSSKIDSLKSLFENESIIEYLLIMINSCQLKNNEIINLKIRELINPKMLFTVAFDYFSNYEAPECLNFLISLMSYGIYKSEIDFAFNIIIKKNSFDFGKLLVEKLLNCIPDSVRRFGFYLNIISQLFKILENLEDEESFEKKELAIYSLAILESKEYSFGNKMIFKKIMTNIIELSFIQGRKNLNTSIVVGKDPLKNEKNALYLSNLIKELKILLQFLKIYFEKMGTLFKDLDLYIVSMINIYHDLLSKKEDKASKILEEIIIIFFSNSNNYLKLFKDFIFQESITYKNDLSKILKFVYSNNKVKPIGNFTDPQGMADIKKTLLFTLLQKKQTPTTSNTEQEEDASKENIIQFKNYLKKNYEINQANEKIYFGLKNQSAIEYLKSYFTDELVQFHKKRIVTFFNVLEKLPESLHVKFCCDIFTLLIEIILKIENENYESGFQQKGKIYRNSILLHTKLIENKYYENSEELNENVENYYNFKNVVIKELLEFLISNSKTLYSIIKGFPFIFNQCEQALNTKNEFLNLYGLKYLTLSLKYITTEPSVTFQSFLIQQQERLNVLAKSDHSLIKSKSKIIIDKIEAMKLSNIKNISLQEKEIIDDIFKQLLEFTTTNRTKFSDNLNGIKINLLKLNEISNNLLFKIFNTLYKIFLNINEIPVFQLAQIFEILFHKSPEYFINLALELLSKFYEENANIEKNISSIEISEFHSCLVKTLLKMNFKEISSGFLESRLTKFEPASLYIAANTYYRKLNLSLYIKILIQNKKISMIKELFHQNIQLHEPFNLIFLKSLEWNIRKEFLLKQFPELIKGISEALFKMEETKAKKIVNSLKIFLGK